VSERDQQRRKMAMVMVDRIEEMLRMNRKERRQAGIKLTVGELRGALKKAREQAR
jgi:hypothetical protein